MGHCEWICVNWGQIWMDLRQFGVFWLDLGPFR